MPVENAIAVSANAATVGDTAAAMASGFRRRRAVSRASKGSFRAGDPTPARPRGKRAKTVLTGPPRAFAAAPGRAQASAL
jgi:hypothetical protein